MIFQSKLDPENIINFAYIQATVLLAVYGQLVVKWQVGQAGAELPCGGGRHYRQLRIKFPSDIH
jgi:hypothetical protein